MDQLLQWIVDKVENGELNEGILTVVVPGGIFSGELIPTWRFVQIMGQSIMSDEEKLRPNGGEKRGKEVPRNPVLDSEYLHFYLPVVYDSTKSSDEGLIMPALRVRIDSISAWVSGGLRPRQEK